MHFLGEFAHFFKIFQPEFLLICFHPLAIGGIFSLLMFALFLFFLLSFLSFIGIIFTPIFPFHCPLTCIPSLDFLLMFLKNPVIQISERFHFRINYKPLRVKNKFIFKSIHNWLCPWLGRVSTRKRILLVRMAIRKFYIFYINGI